MARRQGLIANEAIIAEMWLQKGRESQGQSQTHRWEKVLTSLTKHFCFGMVKEVVLTLLHTVTSSSLAKVIRGYK